MGNSELLAFSLETGTRCIPFFTCNYSNGEMERHHVATMTAYVLLHKMTSGFSLACQNAGEQPQSTIDLELPDMDRGSGEDLLSCWWKGPV